MVRLKVHERTHTVATFDKDEFHCCTKGKAGHRQLAARRQHPAGLGKGLPHAMHNEKNHLEIIGRVSSAAKSLFLALSREPWAGIVIVQSCRDSSQQLH